MTFHPDAVGDFLAMFETVAPRIRGFDGCQRLELWEDARYPNILSTYSHWDSAIALDAYRHSALFRDTWAKTKTWFAAPTVAHSQHVRVGPI